MPRTVPSQIVALIDQLFPEAATASNLKLNHDHAPRLAAIVRLIEEVPSELLVVSGSDYSNLMLGLSTLEHMVAHWRARGGGVTVTQKVNKVHALQLIRQALTKCPDQAPTSDTHDLSFIEDAGLRASIRQDISSSHSSLHNGEWKAATVLAGSATEALLLWGIQNRAADDQIDTAIQSLLGSALTKQPDNSKEKWQLHEYIEVALAIQLISSDSSGQARLAKGFRNLVHPGRALRLKQQCNRATALSAVAAVEHVANDLAQRSLAKTENYTD